MKHIRDKYTSPAYWTQLIQILVYENIKRYLETNKMTQKAFAEKLGVSKGYVSQILNGEFDHKLSKLVKLALACDMVPKIEFIPIESAAQVAKKSYIQPTDWRLGESFSSKVLFKPSISASVKFVSVDNSSIERFKDGERTDVWQTQYSFSDKIA